MILRRAGVSHPAPERPQVSRAFDESGAVLSADRPGVSALGAGLPTPPSERPEVSLALDGQDAPGVRTTPETAPAKLFMAAVAGETIKGYHVAHEACRILRQTRSDFELVVTFDPPGADRRIHSLGRLVLVGRAAAALSRGGYLPGADDCAGFAQPHFGRGDGLGHSRDRQPDRRAAVYGH